MVSFYKKILQIGVILFSLNCQSCSGCNCLNKAIDIPDGDFISYEQLISKMDKYLTPNCSPFGPITFTSRALICSLMNISLSLAILSTSKNSN